MKLSIGAAVASVALSLAAATPSGADDGRFIYLQYSGGGATVFTEPGSFSGNLESAETKTALFAKLQPAAKAKGVDCTASSLQVIGPFDSEAAANKDRADMISFQGGVRVEVIPYPR